MNTIFNIRFLIGIVVCGGVGFIAMALVERFIWLSSSGLSLLTMAILLGIMLGNMPFLPSAMDRFSPGIQFVKQKILRLGIILYGLRLTFQDISNVGLLGALIDVTIFLSTFALAIYLGVRYFKIDKETAILIGAGSSICGAAAILATEPVVKARNDKVAVAISTVVIFGTISIFAYPILYQLSHQYFTSLVFPMQFGIYIGSTIHEVAQVLAAAHSVGSGATDTAVIAKMMRVIMLAPFLVILSISLTYIDKRKPARVNSDLTAQGNGSQGLGSAVPWFAVVFILVIALNSFHIFPEKTMEPMIQIDNFLLACAMAGLGLTTKLSAIKDAGLKPLLLAFVLFLWLVFGGALINILLTVLWNFSATY